jgi:tripartite-type tricarboxylate transporter receptor subunit TctC
MGKRAKPFARHTPQLPILKFLLAPANTPADIVAKLTSSGMEPAPSTPAALKATIAADIAVHAELVKAAGIQPQE